MGAFHRSGLERINAFPVGGAFYFKHYFEARQVFAELARYYDDTGYRFEVPAGRFPTVQEFLSRHGYALVPVEEVAAFTVVKRKYTEHPRMLFEGSVYHVGLRNFNCFVMKDQANVEQAVAQGATRFRDTPLTLEDLAP